MSFTSSSAAANGAPAEVLLVGPLLPSLVAAIESRHRVHRLWEAADPEHFARTEARHSRAIVTSGRFGASRALIESLPALEAIVSFGVGVDAIDLEAARARGVTVTNTPQVLDECVADTALALMLAVSRRIVAADRFVRESRWARESFGLGRKVSGKRCGVAGLGNIGLEVARRAEAFGMAISYFNRRPRPDVPAHYTYCADIATLARNADFLVLCVPGGAQTRHLVDAEVLRAMPAQACLINVARGSVVDEAALVAALQSGHLAAAGLDVYEHEPHPPAALLALEQTVLLPHIASATEETRQAMADLMLANLTSWFERGVAVTPV
ncbi:MAG: 2-hydroxyacid dehydrogenase [Comamonas sp.]